MPDRALIERLADLETYSPPGHSGTVNRRLVEGALAGSFEMVHGTIAPGGQADRHAHATEFQAFYVLGGRAAVTLGGDPSVEVGAGAIVRIPPGLEHVVESLGPEDLRLLIVYAPPLVR